jgi:hypothetical protein
MAQVQAEAMAHMEATIMAALEEEQQEDAVIHSTTGIRGTSTGAVVVHIHT